MICNMKNDRLKDIPQAEKNKAVSLADWLLANGISAVSTGDIAEFLNIPKNQVPQRMLALRRRREIVSPAKGLWLPVPPEYRTWGAPPAFEMIDVLMRWANVGYYVGWLSAAALMGASHHAPQVFQVAVTRTFRNRKVGRSALQFYSRERIDRIPVQKLMSKSGTVSVSSREATLLDVCNDVELVGGIDNAANLVIELCDTETPSIADIIALSNIYPASAIRRLGWLMQTFTEISGIETLQKAAYLRDAAASTLDPLTGKAESILDLGWNLKINRKVEPDV